MRQWWDDRPPRERALMTVGATIAAAFLLYQFLVLPLVRYRAAAAQDYAAALEMLREVETGARAIQQHRAAMEEQGEAPMRTVVAATATELGLSLTRLQPSENGDLDTWLDDAAPPLLFTWIARLHERHGIGVARAVIQRNDGATVSAQITFAGTGP